MYMCNPDFLIVRVENEIDFRSVVLILTVVNHFWCTVVKHVFRSYLELNAT